MIPLCLLVVLAAGCLAAPSDVVISTVPHVAPAGLHYVVPSAVRTVGVAPPAVAPYPIVYNGAVAPSLVSPTYFAPSTVSADESATYLLPFLPGAYIKKIPDDGVIPDDCEEYNFLGKKFMICTK